VTIGRRTTDLAVVAAVAAAMTLTIAVAQEEDATREPDAFAYLLGAVVAALLLLRRRQPVLMMIGSAGLLMIYFGLGYPAFSAAVPLAAAAYFTALAGHVRAAAAVVGGILLIGAAWQTVGEGKSLFAVLGMQTLTEAALMAAVLMLAVTVRSRRAWAEEVQGRVQREERLRIAREVHDVMAHTIAAMNVQASVGADVIDDDPEQAKAALRTIRDHGRAAIAELKATVGVLRDAPAPGLAGLDALARTAGDAGLAVDVSVSGRPRPLRDAVDLAAYRIVQESLTNVIRHAGASRASVRVRYEVAAVVVEVEDDGRGGGANGAGHGLAGMRERAAALGGELLAGPAPDGGFRVHAELPA
jgi:signal transduction histidine kinase